MTDTATAAAEGAAAEDRAATTARPGPTLRAAQTTRAATETVIGALVWTAIWALLLDAMLDMFHTHGDVKRLVAHTLYRHFPLFALSAAIVWVVILLVLAITGRLWLTCAITLCAVIALGMVDQAKMDVRNEPVYPSDLDFLKSPEFLFSMVSPGRLVLGLLCLAVVAALVLLAGRIPQRTFRPIRRHATPRYWRATVIARVVTAVLCLVTLNYAANFNSGDNKVRAAFESAGAEWAFWYQDINYTRNGVVAGILYNLLADPMVEPPGYSKQAMDDIAARWQAAADQVNATRTGDIADVNVVSVLSEAFSDPTRLKGITVDGDPIPYTRELMSESTSGTMLAQLYGGGTANMEFENLSGQSLSQFQPQVNTPYQQFVHGQPDYPTIIGYLEQFGHRAIAIHPYMTAMYQRNKVYKTFGIEDFIHDSTMHSAETIDKNKFISDESAFDEVVRQVDRTTKPLFVNLVTMQNHWPMKNKYKDPWPVTADSKTEGELAGYARGINHSDVALKKFIAELSRSKERTAVVFYGDHLPGIYSGKVHDANGDVDMKSTPFFIWTNFKTPKLDTAALTSPIYFMPLLFEQIGAQIPPYYALLGEMYQHVPAMELGVGFDPQGNPLETDPAVDQLLHDYRLVQYDLSVGKRYAEDMMFYPR